MGFGVAYDPGQNVKIVKAVKKYPVLYNHNKYPFVEFKIVAEKAWTEVALEIGISEGNCKSRWTNIKACYKRYLRNIIRNKNTKIYYLANDLKFMLPFMNLESNFGDNFNHEDSSDSIVEEDISRNECDFELNTDVGNEVEVKLVDSDGDEESFFISTSNQSEDIIGNYNDQSADWDFFSSLLPDVRRMDNEQKKKFRNALLGAIDTVVYGEDC